MAPLRARPPCGGLGWSVGAGLAVAVLIADHRDKVWRCTECRAIVPRG